MKISNYPVKLANSDMSYSMMLPWTNRHDFLVMCECLATNFPIEDAYFNYSTRSYINGYKYPGSVVFKHQIDFLAFKLKYDTYTTSA